MKKVFWLIIIALLGWAVYSFFRTNLGTTLRPSATNQIQETNVPAGTKEYSSQTFHYSFNYPADWFLTETPAGLVILKPQRELPDERAPIGIDPKGEEPYERSAQEMRLNVLGDDKQEVVVARVHGLRLAGHLSPDLGEEADTYFIFTMLNRDGRLFSIDYSEFSPSASDSRGVYQAVVDSLQFQPSAD
ncbi:MAG: hypothetical protein HYT40_01095 [Candidatus Sungbacteria bacterium]|uniref:Uncharacterized protein n=1 Tax=Candidatus Sungiibacteriota bacterium TaxID=2750080 RepID=A0A931SD74_9BACT|nr:hypothetical protein [Candidatus Sungbacteria bacterium]